jgi:hypothetical protein
VDQLVAFERLVGLAKAKGGEVHGGSFFGVSEGMSCPRGILRNAEKSGLLVGETE